MDRTSALTPARELEGFHLAESAADVRGWDVIVRDGAVAGRVARFLVDVKTRRIRYLAVTLGDTHGRLRARPMRAVLVPVGIARRVDEVRSVYVDLTAEAFTRAPRIPARPVTREDEDATLASFGIPVPCEVRDHDRYNSELFDDSRLFMEPQESSIPDFSLDFGGSSRGVGQASRSVDVSLNAQTRSTSTSSAKRDAQLGFE